MLVLLQACGELKKVNQDFVCHFVGAAGKELSPEQFETLVTERNLQEQVKVHGPLYGAEKEAMLEKVGALVFPTYYHNECFPFVILEAMKAGLPVISTEEGAIPDMVLHGENGLLVNPKDSNDLYEKILQVAKDPALAEKLSKRGRETALAYTWAASARTLETVYEEILAK